MGETTGIIRAVCISEKKGTGKHEVPKVRERGAAVSFGDFGENLVVDGFRFRELPVGTRLQSGEVLLEITQIGKECHSHCEIYKAMGDCIMPREGVFARVLRGGEIKPGDELRLLPAEETE